MKTTKKSNTIKSTTVFGIDVKTNIATAETTAYNNGTLIYKKSLCGSKDLASAHLDNVLDFMKKAKTHDFRKKMN
jgi:hypothetical protein